MSFNKKEPRLPPNVIKEFAAYLVGNPIKTIKTSIEARTMIPNQDTYINLRKNAILSIGYGSKMAQQMLEMDCRMLLSYKGIRSQQAVDVLIGARMPKEVHVKTGLGIASEGEE